MLLSVHEDTVAKWANNGSFYDNFWWNESYDNFPYSGNDDENDELSKHKW